LVHLHRVWSPAELAASRQEPANQLGVAGAGRDRLAVGEDRFICRVSGMPPNVATNGFLPSPRWTLVWMHFRGPCGVSIVAWYFLAIFETDEPVFPGQRLEQRGQHHPIQPVQSVDVTGQQVVLDDAVVPFTLRIRLEPLDPRTSFEFIPAAPGIQQSAFTAHYQYVLSGSAFAQSTLVAAGVAVAVVDRFEVVNVDDRDGERTAGFARRGSRGGQRLRARTPVRESRQRVDVGGLYEHAIALAQLIDVRALPQHAMDSRQQLTHAHGFDEKSVAPASSGRGDGRLALIRQDARM
jgi:hypothetical protein